MNPALEGTLQEIASRNPDWAKQKYQWHVRFDQEIDPDADSVALTAIGYRPTTELSIGFYPPMTCSNLLWFRKSAHSVVTLWVAILGGLLGRLLERTRGVEVSELRRRGRDQRHDSPPPRYLLARIFGSILIALEELATRLLAVRLPLPQQDTLTLFGSHIRRCDPCDATAWPGVTWMAFVMGRVGIEPTTHGFSVRCSTN